MASSPGLTMPGEATGAQASPNVVVVVLDDLGFAQLGCFGSDIATPAIDELARGGLRYNSFHVTALCSPTRACLLTGRNHHRIGMGWLAEIPAAAPGYSARIPPSAGTLPRILRDSGYSTFAVGKWHLTPSWERSAAGPFDLWPLGMGFERFYGFLAPETSQWAPELVSDNGFIEPPRPPEQGYHLSEDLVDHAIQLIQDQQQAVPGKPFFLYLAFGAMHAPHQAPAPWIDRYRGQFDDGWETWRNRVIERQLELGVIPAGTQVPPRPEWVQNWSELSAADRQLTARGMEVFAGFLSHTDAQLGRLVAFLSTIGVLDDTLLLVLSDNGTSSEGGLFGSSNYHQVGLDHRIDHERTLAHLGQLGGPQSYGHYAWGWAWAGNAPFRLWKRYTWLGGVRTPLIAHWPQRFTGGQVRTQFCHAIDVMPTVLDACGVGAPEFIAGTAQMSLDGASFLGSFGTAGAASPRAAQYFEMVGSRSMYLGGWKATTDHVGPTPALERQLIPGSHDYEEDHWALFHLDTDFAEACDVSGEHPEIVDQLKSLWWSEARRNNVLPLEDEWLNRSQVRAPRPYPARHRLELRPGGSAVSESVLPLLREGFRCTAEITVPGHDASGMICALGDWNQGWAFYLLSGRPVLCCSLFGMSYRLAGDPVPQGSSTLRLEFEKGQTKGGLFTLSQDGVQACELEIAQGLPYRWQMGSPGLFVGRDSGLPVSADYQPPFCFTGVLHRVILETGSPASGPSQPGPDRDDIACALRHE